MAAVDANTNPTRMWVTTHASVESGKFAERSENSPWNEF